MEWVIIAAVGLDWLLGDPRWFPHPVKGIARLAQGLERHTRRLLPPRLAGIGTTVGVLSVLLVLAFGSVAALQGVAPRLGAGLSVIWVYFSLAARDLWAHSARVREALERGALGAARARVSFMVGRDTDILDPPGVIKATLESVAESTTDGITAPLFYAVLGGLLGGAAGAALGAMLYRGINTLDSLFGYLNPRYARFGWSAARLDDVANYLPARLTALCMIGCAWLVGGSSARAYRIWRRDAHKHQSPNAGHTEAVMAGALGLALGGPARYQGEWEERPVFGDALRSPAIAHIDQANRLTWVTECGFVGILVGGGWLIQEALQKISMR